MSDTTNSPTAERSPMPRANDVNQSATGQYQEDSFFHRHEKCIAGVSSIGSMFGVIFGLIALGITAYQAIEAKKLIYGSTIFQINKEARELVSSMHSDPTVASIVFGSESDEAKDYPPEAMQKAGSMIWTMIQFYETIYEQHQIGILPPDTWAKHNSSICQFFGQSSVRRWVKNVGYVDRKMADTGFLEFVSACVTATTSNRT